MLIYGVIIHSDIIAHLLILESVFVNWYKMGDI